MSVVANDTVVGLQRTIAELRQQLDERGAELNEAVKQQSATADVLQVINQSRGDLAPVFEAVLDKALGLCGAAFGILRTYDGARLHVAAFRGAPPAYAEHLRRAPPSVGLGPDNALVRLLRGESVVHIADAAEDEALPVGGPIAPRRCRPGPCARAARCTAAQEQRPARRLRDLPPGGSVVLR